MKHVLAFVAALVALAAPLAQGEGPLDEARMTLRQDLVRHINADRRANGLPPVVLDPEASTVADSYCELQIRNGTTGHFTTDGYAPYMRYSFAGGNDGVSENAAAWSANYTLTDRAVYEMARRSEETMMRERPPHDGHRKTILDPYATHVGIGLAWSGGEFRMTQEFIRRYVSWSRPLPRIASTDSDIVAAARPLDGYAVQAISVHHEPFPEAIPARVANSISTYSLPDARRDYLPRLKTWVRPEGDGGLQVIRESYSDGRQGDFALSKDGSFRFAVPFSDGPGIYTVVVWVSGNGGKPFPASNVSIRVDKASYGFAGTR